MDTRSKKFKYTLFAKLLCLALSAICFFTAVSSAFTFLHSGMLFGFEKYLSGNQISFYSCDDFNYHISNDIHTICQLGSVDTASLDEQLSAQAEEKVAEAMNSYLDQKSYIIQSELEYAVNNYDDSYFNYEYSADLVSIPETTTSSSVSTTATWEYVTGYDNEVTPEAEEVLPRNIEAAQKILESSSGRDFLNYEALVRDDAFDTEYSFSCEVTFSDANNNYSTTTCTFHVDNMLFSETQIKKEFYTQYNEWAKEYISSYSNYFYDYEYYLQELNTLHYYTVSKEGTVYTNLKEKPDADDVKSYNVYAIVNTENIEFKGIENEDRAEAVEDWLKSCTSKELYIFLEYGLSATIESDVYSDMYSAYVTYSQYEASTLITVCVITVILAIVFLIAFLLLCGHTNDFGEIKTAFIDKLPTDIHFLLTCGLLVLAAGLLFGILDVTVWNYYNAYIYYQYINAITAALVTVCWLLLSEWLASTLRIKKSGQSFFKSTLIAKLLKWIGKGSRKLNIKIKKVFSYKPQKMQKQTIMLIIGYVVVNLIILIFASIAAFAIYEGLLCLICIGVFITFNALVAIFFMKYIRMFDDIITASCENKNVVFGNEKVPEELRLLSENLSNSNQQLEEAIAQAIKEEQMKTELITNVSHDLKTPLTSLITYSDLLSKCNITDENAIKYTDVIHKQSIKLKRLIEDLIEASKVSTGNVTLNKSVLNLSELAVQAIVEFAPEAEKNGNEIKFDEPEYPPKVYADGSKTYRIISNLLNNAKKYSAPYTRIYVSVYSDGISGYFEIKNISAEPLNISPEELTERFVRGDKSRSKEGNGLGLSIAKDLCTIQDGELKLIIDGDLFKAIVKLPCKNDEPVKTEDTVVTVEPE